MPKVFMNVTVDPELVEELDREWRQREDVRSRSDLVNQVLRERYPQLPVRGSDG